nr:hypothetical protein [Tanacetum cinerariifolium]
GDEVVVGAQRRGLAFDGAIPLIAAAVASGLEELHAPAVEDDDVRVGILGDAVDFPSVIEAVAVGREGVGDAHARR